MSSFTNSPLIAHTRLSPNRNSPRNQPIRKITIHHWAGVSTIENIGAFLANPDRRASYNYGIGSDGRIALYVAERDRSWASSSGANDHQAVTIGVGNSATGGDWPVSDRAYAALIDLCVDICQRNGIPCLGYDGTANGTLTRHNFFANTTCPGNFLQRRFPQIAEEVNRRLGAAPTTPPPTPSPVFRVGDIVRFTGNEHFVSSNAAAGVAARPGKARITQIASNARRPFHLVAERGGGSNVHGWVNMLSVEAIATTPPPQPKPTPEEITVDAAMAAGIITDRAHWLGVLTGVIQPNRGNIKALLDRAVERAR